MRYKSVTCWPFEYKIDDIIEYSCSDGYLYWKERPLSMFSSKGSCKSWNSRQSGEIALSKIDKDGYRGLTVFGRSFMQHRIVWMMHNDGSCPEFLDHINGNKSDNRIENLRPATKVDNGWNRGKNKNNTSGYKGVCFMKRKGVYRASVYFGGRAIHAGFHSTAEEAHLAYCKKLKEVAGEFFHE